MRQDKINEVVAQPKLGFLNVWQGSSPVATHMAFHQPPYVSRAVCANNKMLFEMHIWS